MKWALQLQYCLGISWTLRQKDRIFLRLSRRCAANIRLHSIKCPISSGHFVSVPFVFMHIPALIVNISFLEHPVPQTDRPTPTPALRHLTHQSDS